MILLLPNYVCTKVWCIGTHPPPPFDCHVVLVCVYKSEPKDKKKTVDVSFPGSVGAGTNMIVVNELLVTSYKPQRQTIIIKSGRVRYKSVLVFSCSYDDDHEESFVEFGFASGLCTIVNETGSGVAVSACQRTCPVFFYSFFRHFNETHCVAVTVYGTRNESSVNP